MKFSSDIIDNITIVKDKNKTWTSGALNTMSLITISLVWGHMLGLISLWFLPLTITCALIGYGSEITQTDKPTSKTNTVTTLNI